MVPPDLHLLCFSRVARSACYLQCRSLHLVYICTKLHESLDSSKGKGKYVETDLVLQYSRFIEQLDEAPAIRSPNSSMTLIWQPKTESSEPLLSTETVKSPVVDDEVEIPVGKSVKIRISNTHLQRSNAIHRPRRSRTPHPTARRTIRVVDGPGPVTFSASKMKPRPVLLSGADDDIPPLDLGPPLSPLIVPQKRERTDPDIPEYPCEGREQMNESNETFDYELVEASPVTEQGPARDPPRGRLSKIARKIADGISYMRDPWQE